MSHSELVDTLFLGWLAEHGAVETPQDIAGLAENLADISEIACAYREKHPEQVLTLSKRSLDNKMITAVERRIWFLTNTKGPNPPPCYYHNDNAKAQLFRLHSDWSIRFEHHITDRVYPTEASVPALTAILRQYHKGHFAQSSGDYPGVVQGVAKGLGLFEVCAVCKVAKSDPVPLYAAHIFAKKWSKVLLEKENFDSFNGLLLCHGCHYSLDVLEISLVVLPKDLGFRWIRKDGSFGDVLIPQDGEAGRGYGRLLDFIDLRNFYLANSRYNSLKTKEQ